MLLRSTTLDNISVYFGPLKLGRLLEEHMRIEDANGKLKRRNP